MACLWRKTQKGTTYEVRSAGNTRRLYTDGVFHSQFNPRQPVAGSVWDLLLLPGFFFPRDALKRVLVLGVGGGAVIRQLNHFFELDAVVGVELNPVHLTVARRFFGADQANVSLVQGDAIAWVKKYKGPGFDLIIDDLFGEEDGEPVRAVVADRLWVKALLACLKPSGALVMNFDSRQAMKASAPFSDKAIAKEFSARFQLTTPRYDNHIAALMRSDVSRKDLYGNLTGYPELNLNNKSCRLNFNLRKV